MSYKIKVKYLNNLGKVSSYFWKRAIRRTPDGRYGVKVAGKIYPLYRGNFINHDDKNDFSLKECPKTKKKEAKEAVEQLPLLASNPVEWDGKKFNIGEVIHYEDVPGFSFPKYNDDWYIEKRDTGLYVTVNESDSRIENIKGILSNPEKYNCIDVGGGKSTIAPDINEFGEPEFPDDITIYLPPDPINENIDINKKTFFSRYGEFDFFHSKSFKPAPNNIQYDYFFRFEPTISENLIKDMFEDILRVSEASKLLHNLESFLNHDDVETEQTDELIKKIQTLDKDKSQSDELVNLYSSELEELRNEYIELNNNHQKLIKSHEDLKKRYTKARRTNVTDFEKRMHKYLNIEVLPRGLKAVNKHFEDTQKLEDIIYKMDGQDRNMRLKKVQKTKSWKEVDQKISNGYDNQGRLYVCILNNKKIILIGHKQDQPEDITFMIKNDPPTLD